jgi:hypothetical protein
MTLLGWEIEIMCLISGSDMVGDLFFLPLQFLCSSLIALWIMSDLLDGA